MLTAAGLSMRAPTTLSPTTPVQSPIPVAPEPPPKVVEVIKSPLPCVDNAEEMTAMIRAGFHGGDN
jgi:hypothetical protein